MTVSLLAADNIRWSPFWLAIGMIFVVERLVTVWRGGVAGPAARRTDVSSSSGTPCSCRRASWSRSSRSCSDARPTGTTSRDPRPAAPGAVAARWLSRLGHRPSRDDPRDRLVPRAGLVGRVQHPRLRLPQHPAAVAAAAPPYTSVTSTPATLSPGQTAPHTRCPPDHAADSARSRAMRERRRRRTPWTTARGGRSLTGQPNRRRRGSLREPPNAGRVGFPAAPPAVSGCWGCWHSIHPVG